MMDELSHKIEEVKKEPVRFKHFSSLIDSGGELNQNDLMGALERKEIMPEQFSELLAQLIANSQELTKFKKKYGIDSLAGLFDRFHMSPK